MVHQYKEIELLRMSKNELIEHIFELYKSNDIKWQRLVEWDTAFEEMRRLKEESCI